MIIQNLCYSYSRRSCLTDSDINKAMNNSTSTVLTTLTSIASLSVLDIGPNEVENVVGIPWGQIALFLVVSIIILIGNSLVITTVLRYEFLQTPTNVFVVGTACLDLIMGLNGMFKVGQLVYVYEGYYTCMARLGIGALQGVLTGNLLAGTIA